MVQFVTKAFSELSTHELYQLLQLRAEVFVVEQQCPYLDMDNKDLKALHVLGYDANRLVASARLLPGGISYDEASIGRVVTHASVRRFGYGKLLMQYSINECLQRFHTNEIVISAQLYLKRFYTELGFIAEGEVYPEDDIPHIQMRLKKELQ